MNQCLRMLVGLTCLMIGMGSATWGFAQAHGHASKPKESDEKPAASTQTPPPKSPPQGIWEYQPYKAQVWISFDPRLSISEATMDALVSDLSKEIDRTFAGTFETSISATPRFLDQLIYQEYETFNVERLLESELVLAISKDIPGSNTMRSMESVSQKLERFPVDTTRIEEMTKEFGSLKDDPIYGPFGAKLSPFAGNTDAMIQAMLAGELEAGIVSKFESKKLSDKFRSITLRLPWQVESMLRRQDKIFFVRVSRVGELLRTQVRELDCPVQELGAIYQGDSALWQHLSRVACDTLTRSFVPIARIEEVNDKTVSMRVRAAGLIAYEGHPATIYPGDVLRPMLPKADRSGGAGQSIPWTYVAATYGDGIRLSGTVFSAMKSPLGNQKKKVTRTALRVQHPFETTDLQLMMKPLHVGKGPAPPSITAPGMSIYERTPSLTNLDLVGRSDWRGIFTIKKTELPEIEYELPSATPEAVPPTTLDPNAPAVPAEPVEKPKAKVRLRSPLFLYYIKNGDTVLTRLPIVTGMNPREIAELPDDTRRLEAEAFVKGLQFAIIDNVARRRILASRIKMRVEEGNELKAREFLKDLKETKSYDNLAMTLDLLQRRVNDPAKGPVPLITQRRIDALFDTTRTMMQKYMQDNLLQELSATVEAKFPKYEEVPAESATEPTPPPAEGGGS